MFCFVQVEFSQNLVPQQTVVNMKKDDSSKPNVFMFSAIEGFVSALEEVASKLSYNIYGLQCTEDAPTDSMGSMAKFFVAVCICISRCATFIINILFNLIFRKLKKFKNLDHITS